MPANLTVHQLHSHFVDKETRHQKAYVSEMGKTLSINLQLVKCQLNICLLLSDYRADPQAGK